MESSVPLIPCILCGGAGSRLWPVSRELHPKPFIRLADGESLLQKAFLRGVRLAGVQDVLTVTNESQFLKVQEELSEVNQAKMQLSFILEPFARNTAAAIAAAALEASNLYGPKAILLVLAADHLISQQKAFQKAVSEAVLLAKAGKLVTFGIKASRPETGYGYIEAEGSRVLRFIEKPGLQDAEQFVEAGRYLWNSGMFCFEVAVLLEEMALHCPELLVATKNCLAQSKRATFADAAQVKLASDSFNLVQDISIDYALMEKSEQVAVVPCDLGWSDVGSWNALSLQIKPDSKGNQFEGDVVEYAVNNCYIKTEKRLVAAVAIENLVIIDTEDALLVANKSNLQNVKDIYQQLKHKNHEAHRSHATVFRPWGTYTVLEEGEGFKIKRIVVKPGASLSLQKHQYRSEHWVVVQGIARVTNGDKILDIHTNESTYIPAGNKHRLQNTSNAPAVIIEIQSGSYVGEDDIQRFEDIYGRVIEETV